MSVFHIVHSDRIFGQVSFTLRLDRLERRKVIPKVETCWERQHRVTKYASNHATSRAWGAKEVSDWEWRGLARDTGILALRVETRQSTQRHDSASKRKKKKMTRFEGMMRLPGSVHRGNGRALFSHSDHECTNTGPSN